jgi:hypothetical protein
MERFQSNHPIATKTITEEHGFCLWRNLGDGLLDGWWHLAWGTVIPLGKKGKGSVRSLTGQKFVFKNLTGNHM